MPRKPVDDTRFEQAMALKNEGRFNEALALLQELYAEAPDRLEVVVMLGGTNFLKRDYPAALEWFRQATMLSPSSELASVGLYHCLAKQVGLVEALDEMKRYLASYPSAEYSRILEDIKKADEKK